MQNHNIDRIAVVGFSRRYKPPIIRIGKTGEQRLRQRKCLELRVVNELRPAAPGRFDHYVNVTIFGEGWKVNKI